MLASKALRKDNCRLAALVVHAAARIAVRLIALFGRNGKQGSVNSFSNRSKQLTTHSVDCSQSFLRLDSANSVQVRSALQRRHSPHILVYHPIFDCKEISAFSRVHALRPQDNPRNSRADSFDAYDNWQETSTPESVVHGRRHFALFPEGPSMGFTLVKFGLI